MTVVSPGGEILQGPLATAGSFCGYVLGVYVPRFVEFSGYTSFMARPRLPEGHVRDKTLRIRISAGALERLDAAAGYRGMNRSQAVRQALSAWVDGEPAQPEPVRGGTVEVVSTHRTDQGWCDHEWRGEAESRYCVKCGEMK